MSSPPWLFTTHLICLCQQPHLPRKMQLARHPASSKELKATPLRCGDLLSLSAQQRGETDRGRQGFPTLPSWHPQGSFLQLGSGVKAVQYLH